MAGRIAFEVLLALLVIGAILYGVYRLRAYQLSQQPPEEEDLSVVPSLWFTASWTLDDDHTAVGIQRVEIDSMKVLERRRLRVIDNTLPGYAATFDAAMDEAYEATTKANVSLARR